MSALPGTPAIQNAIPMPFFGTTAFAAPGLGMVASILMFGIGLAWLERRAAGARAAGEGYGEHADSLPKPDVVMREHAQNEGFDIAELPDKPVTDASLPPFWLALLPVIVVTSRTSFLSSSSFRGWTYRFLITHLSQPAGIWYKS